MFAKTIRGEWYDLFGDASDPLSDFHNAGQMGLIRVIPSSCPRPRMSSKSPLQPTLLVLSTPYKSHLPITCRIRLQPHTLAFVRIRLLPVTGGTVVASSGAFTDARSGAAITQVVLRAGQYIIELEVDGPGANVNFTLMVYSMTAGISLAQL